MALGLTQPLTEISTRNVSWGKGGRCVGGQTYHLQVAFVLKSGSLKLLEPSGPVQAYNGIALPLPLIGTSRHYANVPIENCKLTANYKLYKFTLIQLIHSLNIFSNSCCLPVLSPC
jgi:hypothetical protein